MATERLRVILEMVTGQYKREASSAARATDGITKSGQSADTAMSGFSKRMNSIGPGTAAGIIAAGGAIAVGMGKAILALDDLGVQADNIRNKFNVVFGEGADDVADWADEVNERFGVSQVAVQDLASNFADLLVPIGFTREEATGLTQEALVLANALSEWSGGQISVADSTERIRKALLGEREGLKALNVSILQSDLNARLAAKGQSDLTGELKAQAEAQATLEIITEKSADAINAYEKGTNRALIEQKNFNAAVDDGVQALADFVNNEVDEARDALPLLAFVLEDLTDLLTENTEASEAAGEGQQTLTESLLRAIPGIGAAADSLIPLVENYAKGKIEAKGFGDEVEGSGSSAGEAARPIGDLADKTGEAADNTKRLKDETVNLAAELRKQADPVFKAVSAFKDYQDTLQGIDEDGERTSEELLDLAEAVLESESALAELGGGNLERGIEAISAAIGLTAEEVRDLLRELGVLDGTSFTVTGTVIAATANAAAAGSLDPSIAAAARRAGRAHGGAVAGGRAYIVGERGPELFTPSGSGRIQNDFRVAGGGENIVINLNVTTQPGFSNAVIRELDSALNRYGKGIV